MLTTRQPTSAQTVSHKAGNHRVNPSAPEFPDVSDIQIAPQITVGDVTMHTGHLITPVSLYEKSALAYVFHPDTAKEVVSGSVSEDGIYSFVCGAKDYFSPNHLLAFMPQKVMVSCLLNEELHIQRAIMRELIVQENNVVKLGKTYSDVSFESPYLSGVSSNSSSPEGSIVEEPESHSQPATKRNTPRATDADIDNHLRYKTSIIKHRNSIAASLRANGLSATQKRIQEAINTERSKPGCIYKSARVPATTDEIKEQVLIKDENDDWRNAWQIFDDLHEMGKGVSIKRVTHLLSVEIAAQQSCSQTVNKGADNHLTSAACVDEPGKHIPPRIMVGDITMYAGRIITPLSSYQQRVFDWVFHPDTLRNAISGAVSKDSVCSFISDTPKICASNSLLSAIPQKVLVSCLLNEENYIKQATMTGIIVQKDNVVESGEIYSDAFFESPGLSGVSASNPEKNAVEEPESHSQSGIKEDRPVRCKADEDDISAWLMDKDRVRNRDAIAASLRSNHFTVDEAEIQKVIKRKRDEQFSSWWPEYKRPKLSASDSDIEEQIKIKNKNNKLKSREQIVEALHKQGKGADVNRITSLLVKARKAEKQAIVLQKRLPVNASDNDIRELAFDDAQNPRSRDSVLDILHLSDKAAGAKRVMKILKEERAKRSSSGG